MSKKNQNLNLKYVCAIAMSLFSLVALFVGTFAWFQSCRTQLTEADNYVVDTIVGKFSKVTFHQLESKQVNSNPNLTQFHFSKTAVGTIAYDWSTNTFNPEGISTIELGNTNSPYTPLDPEHPLLLLIELTQEYNTTNDGLVTISAHSSSTSFLGARDENGDPINVLSDGEGLVSGTINSNPLYALSSAVQFYTQPFSHDDYLDLTDSNKTTLDFVLGNTTKPTNNFVKIFDNEEDETAFYQDIVIYETPSNLKVQYLAIIIDYFPDAIEYIYSTYLGDSTLEDLYDYDFKYICDWSMEVK